MMDNNRALVIALLASAAACCLALDIDRRVTRLRNYMFTLEDMLNEVLFSQETEEELSREPENAEAVGLFRRLFSRVRKS